ncbi:MAG: transglycosylase SLT domain-containing protein [Candidatus Sungiibacteriota bacterium]
MVPHPFQEKQNPVPPASPTDSSYALEAPKTPILSIEDYAEKTAAENNISPTRFRRLITCESRWKEDAAGDNGTSLGILQFKAATFAHFTKKYNLDAYDYGEQDPYEQMNLAARMIADGYLGHWKNCARKTGWTNEQASQK